MEIAGFEDVEAKIDLIISDSRLAAYLELSLMRASFAAIKSARSRSQTFKKMFLLITQCSIIIF